MGCARCYGRGHENLDFEELVHPVLMTGTIKATHWAMCPVVQQPILMAFLTWEEVMNMETPQPERENMEDARPAEPGTVGDALADDVQIQEDEHEEPTEEE